MISKEKFVKIIDNLKKESDYIDETNKVNTKFQKDSYVMFSISFDIAIDLLGEIFNQEDTEIFYWWIFDMDFGRNFEIGNLKDNDKTPDLSTPELFYDYLIGGMK